MVWLEGVVDVQWMRGCVKDDSELAESLRWIT